MGSTRITVLTDQGPRESTLHTHFEMDSPTNEEWLAELIDQLGNLPTMLDGFTVGAQEPFEPSGLLVFSRPCVVPLGALPPRVPERAWPGPVLPGSKVAADLDILMVPTADIPTMLDSVGDAPRETPWIWGGAPHEVWFRPVLPSEKLIDILGLANPRSSV